MTKSTRLRFEAKRTFDRFSSDLNSCTNNMLVFCCLVDQEIIISYHRTEQQKIFLISKLLCMWTVATPTCRCPPTSKLQEFARNVWTQLMSILDERTMNQTTGKIPIVIFEWKPTQKREFHNCPNCGQVFSWNSLKTRDDKGTLKTDSLSLLSKTKDTGI